MEEVSQPANPAEGDDSSGSLLSSEPVQQVSDTDSKQDSTETASEGEKGPSVLGAPEAYTFTKPDGTEYDKTIVDAYSEVAKELDLSNDAAQKILDKLTPAVHKQQVDYMNKLRTDWADSSLSDKEFGGDKFNDSLVSAKKALSMFGSEELVKLLNETGLGSHPEMIRMFYRAGKSVSDDKDIVVGSSGDSKTAPTDFNSKAAALYS